LKTYRLIGADGREVLSATPGTLGCHRRQVPPEGLRDMESFPSMSDMDYKELDDDVPEFEREGLKAKPREEPTPEAEADTEADEQ
jgi:hypothetical protein